MRLLLDSQAYVWWLAGDRRLGNEARTAISAADSLVYVSAATIWELAIKSALGRLKVKSSVLVTEIAENDFLELPISARHAERAGRLPRHHDDPFDRMLVAQAQLEGLTCVTRDPRFGAYGVATVW